MSQAGRLNGITPVPVTVVETLTGNSGGAVGPTGNNIDVLGDGTIMTVIGNPATSTLTIYTTAVTSLETGSGTADVNSNTMTIAGGTGITTSASGSTVTVTATGGTGTVTSVSAGTGITLIPSPITSTGSVSLTVPVTVANGGTGATTLTGLVLGNGTSALSAISAGDYGVLISSSSGVPSWLANGTTGQVLTATTSGTPSWEAAGASSITITGNSGGGLTGNSFTFTGGTTGLTFAGSGTTETLGGTLALANGGTNANLTASNGGIFYSTASAGAILAGTATADQVLLSGSSTTPAWSTATYPATTTINQLLYSSANNTIGGVTAGDYGVLISSSSGVPSWLANGTTGQVLTATTSGTPSWASAGSSSISITGDSGGALTGNAFTFTGGTTGLTFGGAGTTETLGGTLVVSNGGTGVSSTTAFAVICGGTTSTAALQSVAALGASGSVLTSNGAGALPTFQAAASGGFTWTAETSSTAMTVNNGYISNSSSLLTFTLPSTAAVGTLQGVAGLGTGGWKIAQNASQNIQFGAETTTAGTGGSLSSSLQYDNVQLLCVTANTTWVVLTAVGNLTYV